MDQNKIETNWKGRGFSFASWADPPGHCWEDYVHETDELLMLVEGKIEVEMQGKKIHPKLGEEIFIPARVVHCVRNIGKTENRWFYGYRK